MRRMLARMLQRWDAYWFRPAPLIDLAMCRIAVVGFQLARMLIVHPMPASLHNFAAMPQALYDPLPMLHLFVWPFGWNARPSLAAMQLALGATLIAGFLALVGLRTRVSLALFAAGVLFLHAVQYSFGEVHHSEALTAIVLVLLALAPSGARASIDAVRRSSARTLATRSLARPRPLNEQAAFAAWPLLMVQWLFALVYFSAAASKLAASGVDWANGYTLQHYLLRDWLQWQRPLGLWLSQRHGLAAALSWVTLVFEATFFLVLLRPRLAWVYAPLGALLHLGIVLTMQADFTAYVALYAVFVPWSRVLAWAQARFARAMRGRAIHVIYDGQCPLCLRSVTWLAALDWGRRLAYLDLEKDWARVQVRWPSLSQAACRAQMHVVLPDGRIAQGFFAFRELAWALPLGWLAAPWVSLPGVGLAGDWVYRQVARRRARLEPCTFDRCLVARETPGTDAGATLINRWDHLKQPSGGPKGA